MAEKKITLLVGSKEFEFNVTTEEFNRYINEVKPDDKILPCKRLLRRTLVNAEQKEEIEALCDRGLAINLAGKLIEEFQGDVEIEVKK